MPARVMQDARHRYPLSHIMIEYIFFDATLQNKFVEYAASFGVTCTLQDDPMGMVVAIPEDIGEDVEDALEERYALLEREQSEQLMQEEGGLKRIAGFNYNLPDGQSRMAPLQADIASRLLSVFSIEEIQILFAAVARSALNQEDKPLCKILKDEARESARQE
ncbi:MAG: hypothetical protein WC825_09785 [Gallionellaceae bacterium]